MKEINSKYIKFFAELLKISDKHGFYISGCGCCGSPFIKDEDVEYIKISKNRVEWRESEDRYILVKCFGGYESIMYDGENELRRFDVYE